MTCLLQTPSHQTSELSLKLRELEREAELLRDANRALREENAALRESLGRRGPGPPGERPRRTGLFSF